MVRDELLLRDDQAALSVDFEAKPKELTGRSRSVSKDLTEQMKFSPSLTSAVLPIAD